MSRRLTALPNRVVAYVDLQNQVPGMSFIDGGVDVGGILLTDRAQALMDRAELPPYLLRLVKVASSGTDGVEEGDFWLAMPNEGQWWGYSECVEAGIYCPEGHQMRLYGVGCDVFDQLVARYEPSPS